MKQQTIFVYDEQLVSLNYSLRNYEKKKTTTCCKRYIQLFVKTLFRNKVRKSLMFNFVAGKKIFSRDVLYAIIVFFFEQKLATNSASRDVRREITFFRRSR